MVLKLFQSIPAYLLVWEWCKNVWYSNELGDEKCTVKFENDVKMYGTQTSCVGITFRPGFENDVKMYGTQTVSSVITYDMAFENDVKMYGTQTSPFPECIFYWFENVVKMYGS